MVDLEVLPSLTEGFPSVILEAYAYEKPVLASVEAFPKELELFGAFASFEMFEEKIRELQQADLRGIGRLARNCVKKNFAWEQFAKAVTYYLEKAI